jgi:hypothetical protein
MKDVNLVLREKEMDIARVREEIEALHLAIPLLAENRDWVEHGLALPGSSSQSQETGTPPQRGEPQFARPEPLVS